MDILEPFKDVLAAYSLVTQGKAMASAARQFFQSDTVQGSIAVARVRVRGVGLPAIVERLDDGSNPYDQHLGIDLAPQFSQERIAAALYYRASQSWDYLIQQVWLAIFKQAFRDAQPGDELAIKVALTYLNGLGTQQYVIRGQFGGGAPDIEFASHVNWRRYWPTVWSLVDANAALRKERKVQRQASKAAHRQ